MRDRNPSDERETGVRESGNRGERRDRDWPRRGLDDYGGHDSAGAERGLGLACRGESRRRLRQDRGGRALATAGHHRPDRPGRVRRRRRGDRRGAGAQGRAAGEPSPTPAPNADLATTTSSLGIAEIAAASGTGGRALRPARLQPGAADAAGRGLLPRRRRAAPARRRWPGARRSARRRSRFPTRPASSSTACSSPTSSTRCG